MGVTCCRLGVGGRQRAINVYIDPNKLLKYDRLTIEEELRFIDQAYVRGGRTGLLLQTLLETGARVSEFVQVRTEDVSLAERVIVIDEDQGQSGARADNRSGYQRLLAEVALDHVGIVLGLEMSRLARSNKDWHHLLELCAIFGALLADQEALTAPGVPENW